jgi:hypothetical protein
MGHALTKEHIPTLFAAKVSPQTFFCEISKGYQAFYIKNTLVNWLINYLSGTVRKY